MYRCQKCNVVVGPNQPMNRVVVETRPKTYPVFRRAKGRQRRGAPQVEQVATAEGSEIVRELVLCPSCAAANAEAAT